MNRKCVVVVAIIGTLAATSPASAGGLLADIFVRPFNPRLAEVLDEGHAKLGNPLVHGANVVAGVAADAVVPGSGAAVTAALEANASAKR